MEMLSKDTIIRIIEEKNPALQKQMINIMPEDARKQFFEEASKLREDWKKFTEEFTSK